MHDYSLTKHRIIQWMGILLALGLIAVSYWYFSARAGLKTNTSTVQPQGTGNLDSGLAGYWALDDGTSGATPTSATDSSTNGNTGTLTNGPTWTTGQIRNAVDFDGTDDYVTVADTDILDPISQNITLTGWFNRDTFTTIDTVLAKRNSTSSSDVGYIVYVDATTDKLVFEIAYHDGAPPEYEYQLESTTTFTSSGWNHFAIVWDRESQSNVALYINGKNDSATATGSYADIGSVNNNVAFRLGAESDGGNPFDGKLDEVRVYGRSLSSDEISQLYRLTTPTGTDTGLKGYWSFNAQDTPGSGTYDRSGAGNTGTFIGSPTKALGKAGQALDFDGTDDYVSIADSASLDIGDTEDLTLSGWFYRDTFTTDDTIIAKRNGIANTDDGYILYIDDTTDKLTFEVSENSGTDEYQLESIQTFTSTGWYHFAIVWDQDSAANSEIYINGLANSATDTGTIGNLGDLGNALVLAIGAESDAGNPFDGKLDEVRVYKRTLSTAEIKSFYDLSESDKTNTSASQPQGTGNLDSGLAGYWRLDDGSGTSATDASTNGNTGTLTNMEEGDWVTGQIGGAVDFDGTNEYVDLGTSTFGIATGSKELTLSAWAYVRNFQSYPVIIGKNQSGNPYGGWQINVNGDSGNRFGGGVNVSGTWTGVTSDSTYSTSTWYHVTMTYDGANLKLYVNGVLDKTVAASGTIQYASTSSSVGIGRNFATEVTDQYLNGRVDEARIYNRTLSADEIARLYRLTTPTAVDTSLRAYWSFNAQDMNGSTVYDRSGRPGNSGTAGNTTKTIGKVGQALSFNGSTSIVNISNSSSSLSTPTYATYSAWIYSSGDPGHAQYILRERNSSAYGLFLAGTTMNLNWRDIFGSTDSGYAIPANRWVFVALTVNNGTGIFYVDGVRVSQQSISVSGAGSAFVTLGSFDDGPTDVFNGKLDEIRIYNRTLSAAEIKALYDLSESDKINTSASQPQGTGNLDSGLAGYWKLDDGSGTSAADSSTNGNTGTLTLGPTWTTGQIGSAVDFDGSDDYITIPSSAPYAIPDGKNFTLSGWFNRDTFTSDHTIIAKRGTLATGNDGFAVYIGGTSDKLSFEGSDGVDEYLIESVSTFTSAGWHHFALSWNDASASATKLYIDGVAEAATTTGTFGNLNIMTNAKAIALGMLSDGGSNFDGKLDEIRFYDRALSADEVVQLYRLTSPTGVDTGLKGYWSFNGQDVSGTTAYDRSGQGNNGTITNAPGRVSGKVGQALDFFPNNVDVDAYVSVGDPVSGALDFGSGDFTISFWMKGRGYTNNGSSNNKVLGKRNQSTGVGYEFMIDSVSNVNQLTFGVGNGSTNYSIVHPMTTTNDNQWHHYVGLRSGSTMYLYDNSLPVVSGSVSGSISNAIGFTIGTDSTNVTTQNTNSAIDEVRVYNRALSAAEVAALYNSSR